MGVVPVKQWQRHTAIMDTTEGVKVVCERCGLQLPLMTKLGATVLTKEDRLYIGDDFRAVDCEL